ncbi:YlzJ-like family protein [Neobacillus sp. FSL H8-0543]|uniref:YlzJ-like family protein n=1 Tax=Neobacillus sp. FSL H8-0543 TaxID=2954672 RepID=UPI003158BD48
MMLYTMVPQELIFPYEPDSKTNHQMVSYQGVPLLVEYSDQQNVQVIRILSSDPQHFLDEQICPGAKISCANIEGFAAN